MYSFYIKNNHKHYIWNVTQIHVLGYIVQHSYYIYNNLEIKCTLDGPEANPHTLDSLSY
jgi:hypothetical protein